MISNFDQTLGKFWLIQQYITWNQMIVGNTKLVKVDDVSLNYLLEIVCLWQNKNRRNIKQILPDWSMESKPKIGLKYKMLLMEAITAQTKICSYSLVIEKSVQVKCNAKFCWNKSILFGFSSLEYHIKYLYKAGNVWL